MAIFKDAYKITMGAEGGYANDPDDRGGETYKGVSRRNFPQWKGWTIIDAAKKNATGFDKTISVNTRLEIAVQEFYKVEFWDVLSLDFVNNQAIANEMFDTAVNCGTGIAAEFLQ